MCPPPRIFFVVVAILLIGSPSSLAGTFLYDRRNTSFDSCVRADTDRFFLENCMNTTIAVEWSREENLMIFEVTINGKCTLRRRAAGRFLGIAGVVGRSGVLDWAFHEDARFCAGRSLRNDGQGGGFWTSVRFARSGPVDVFFVHSAIGWNREFGEFKPSAPHSHVFYAPSVSAGSVPAADSPAFNLPAGHASAAHSATSYAAADDSGSRSAVSFDYYAQTGFLDGSVDMHCFNEHHDGGPHFYAEHFAEQHFGSRNDPSNQVHDDRFYHNKHVDYEHDCVPDDQPSVRQRYTVLFFNQRTNFDGRTTNEFCGAQELLADGRLAAKLGVAEKPGDFIYLIQPTCRSDGDTALFKCVMERRDRSDWAAESVELNEVELLDVTTSNACKGLLSDTFIPTQTMEQIDWTINDNCKLHVEGIEAGGKVILRIEDQTYDDDRGGVNIEDDGTLALLKSDSNTVDNNVKFCQGTSLRNDDGNGHWWTVIGSKNTGKVGGIVIVHFHFFEQQQQHFYVHLHFDVYFELHDDAGAHDFDRAEHLHEFHHSAADDREQHGFNLHEHYHFASHLHEQHGLDAHVDCVEHHHLAHYHGVEHDARVLDPEQQLYLHARAHDFDGQAHVIE
ncbi:hypothetical protein M3Y99_00703700 [Aphelenchoides fujianensis]|nr:hypothetical protein M3Y99_00703700 [Aphelenchoides fujianensis]